jgi:hypothetical protein
VQQGRPVQKTPRVQAVLEVEQVQPAEQLARAAAPAARVAQRAAAVEA